MTSTKEAEKRTAQRSIGLETGSPAPTVDLLGTDTQAYSETPETVAERYRLQLEKKRIERKLDAIDEVLKKRTGERQVGAFWVNVTSSTRETVDTEAVREILGDATPIKSSVAVRLTVVPA